MNTLKSSLRLRQTTPPFKSQAFSSISTKIAMLPLRAAFVVSFAPASVQDDAARPLKPPLVSPFAPASVQDAPRARREARP